MVRRSLADPDLEGRFRERQVLASLEHPHIARLLDGGARRRRAVLRHGVRARRAADRLRDARRSASAARLALPQDLFGAVSYAHRNLVVHRDLKPSNILVTGRRRAKLIDFGLAQDTGHDARARGGDGDRHGFRAFTPSYASPEQVHGEQVDDRHRRLLARRRPLRAADRPARRSTRPRHLADMLRTLDTTDGRAAQPRAGPAGRDTKVGRRGAPPYRAAVLDRRSRQHHLDRAAARAGAPLPVGRGARRRRPALSRAGRWRRIQDAALSRRQVRAAAHRRRGRHGAGRRAPWSVASAVSIWQGGIAREQRDGHAPLRGRPAAVQLAAVRAQSAHRAAARRRQRPRLLVRAGVEYLDSLATESADDPGAAAGAGVGLREDGDLRGQPDQPQPDRVRRGHRQPPEGAADRASGQPGRGAGAPRALAENSACSATLQPGQRVRPRRRRPGRSPPALRAGADADPDGSGAAAWRWRRRCTMSGGSSRTARATPRPSRRSSSRSPLRNGCGRGRRPTADVLRLLARTRAQDGRRCHGRAGSARREARWRRRQRSTSRWPPRSRRRALRNGLWSVYWLTSGVYEEQDDVRSHAFALRRST